MLDVWNPATYNTAIGSLAIIIIPAFIIVFLCIATGCAVKISRSNGADNSPLFFLALTTILSCVFYFSRIPELREPSYLVAWACIAGICGIVAGYVFAMTRPIHDADRPSGHERRNSSR